MAGDSKAYTGSGSTQLQAGIINRIRMENFMCHSNLEIELGDSVNFITGQNGSGKSAILTALLIAFGCRAKGTQRASTLKDFIKTGCSHAMVSVEIKNEGEDAFKPNVFGDLIIIERSIAKASSTTVIKNHQGKKVAGRREDLRELVEHFSIDVENPCVIMSQDKSREFLHSGNDRDKFRFFFKATLLSQVDDLLKSINRQLEESNAAVNELESTIRPVQKELNELQLKIRNMEEVEGLSLQVQLLRKKVAWSMVYGMNRQLEEQIVKIDSLKRRIPKCQERIDYFQGKVVELTDLLNRKKEQISSMMERTSEVRRMKEELQQALSLAKNERIELGGVRERKLDYIRKFRKRVESLEKQSQVLHEQERQSTQAEESEIEAKLKELQDEFDEIDSKLLSLKEEEEALFETLSTRKEEVERIYQEIESWERRHREINSQIREIRLNQTNKVTAFGGPRVTDLLRAIERHHHRFNRPPIGPIGAHVSLVQGDFWAAAVENAVGKMLNAFIVTDHKDLGLLRQCARDARYNHLQIVIYDFSRPRLHIPAHLLPQTQHPTTISVLHSENPTVMNVLVDLASAERQVLVRSYDIGKTVAFDQRVANLKEVYTLEGHKMFSRGSAQTILPPNKKARTGRLSGSYDRQIENLERESSNAQDQARTGCGKKRSAEEGLQELGNKLQLPERRRVETEREMTQKKLALRDTKNSLMAEKSRPPPASSINELHYEISKLKDEIQEREKSLEETLTEIKEAEAKARDLKLSSESLCESAKAEIDALEAAERELMRNEEDLQSAIEKKRHYEEIMGGKVLIDIKEAEAQYEELKINKANSYKKASIICPESEIEALGGVEEGTTPDQLNSQLKMLNKRLHRENERFTESIEDLKMLYERKERKILKKKQAYAAFRDRNSSCRKALKIRWNKFQSNASDLMCQLTWKFNGHLGKKGISGQVKVSYKDETLSIEVKMPQDASKGNVHDTRGLSGGERSFSTLCFALALHDMTEAPFRAMDEFDVFMDAISRKISLETLVEFALDQGSQWIFITPHDISMVKQTARIKKQQMSAPRS